MARTRVIAGVIYAPAQPYALPDRVTGRDAATARGAAFRLLSVMLFSRSRNATARGNVKRGARLAADGLRMDGLARDLDWRGRL